MSFCLLSSKFFYEMPVDIKNVLVCDAVDQSCVDLLTANGIEVDYKLKLPKDVLVEEAKVSTWRRGIYCQRRS